MCLFSYFLLPCAAAENDVTRQATSCNALTDMIRHTSQHDTTFFTHFSHHSIIKLQLNLQLQK